MTRRSLFALAYILPFMRKPGPEPELDALILRDRVVPDIQKVLEAGIRGHREKIATMMKESLRGFGAPTAASKEFSDAVARFDLAVQREELPTELL